MYVPVCVCVLIYSTLISFWSLCVIAEQLPLNICVCSLCVSKKWERERDRRRGREKERGEQRKNQRPNQWARVLGQKAINSINKVQPHDPGGWEKRIIIDTESNCVFWPFCEPGLLCCWSVSACMCITLRWSPFTTSAMQQKTQKKRERKKREAHVLRQKSDAVLEWIFSLFFFSPPL